MFIGRYQPYYSFATATVNPVSGCQNCDHKPWWERPRCELGKLACEYDAYDKKVTKDVSTSVRNSVLGQSNAVQNTVRDWIRSAGQSVGEGLGDATTAASPTLIMIGIAALGVLAIIMVIR
jgi:hypothetical protein